MSEADSTLQMLRDSALKFLAERADKSRLRGWIGHARPVDLALWSESAELGWAGVILPESLGGVGLGMAEAAVLCEAAGRHLFGEPLVGCALMPSVLFRAAQESKMADSMQGVAADMAEGRKLVAVAWQDKPGQLLPSAPTCVLTNGRLTGSVRFVPGGAEVGVLLVWAHDGEVPHIVAIDCASEGVACEVAAAGLSSQTEWRFDDVPLMSGGVLLRGSAAESSLCDALWVGRMGLACELLGLAEGCLALTVEHVRTRQQFDRAIGSFQSVQHRCVDLHIEVELARASIAGALNAYQSTTMDGRGRASAVDAICLAKARAGDVAVRVGRESVQLHGAMGFCEELDIGLYLRAALAGQAWLGSPRLLRRMWCQGEESSFTQARECVNG